MSSFLLARRRCIPVRGHWFIIRSVTTATTNQVPVNVGKRAPSPTATKGTASSLTKKPALFSPKSASSSPRQNPPKDAANNARERSSEETLDEIERLLRMSQSHPTIDPWGQVMETLDVHMPYTLSSNSLRNAGWSTAWNRVEANMLDNVKSAISMYRMAAVDSFHNVDLSRAGLIDKIFRWPFHIFKCRSTKSNAWIAGLRTQALDTYKALNKAVSAQNTKVIKHFTAPPYMDSTLRLLRKRSASDVYIWRMHEPAEDDPPLARVLSLRATDGYFARSEPKIGNRLVIHALVKFDTKQSLQIFSKQGDLLHTQEPKRVVEYLVLERRMWYSTPWMIREQLHENPGVHI